jgi:hypothetical protein
MDQTTLLRQGGPKENAFVAFLFGVAALRFSIIRENLDKLRESIASGALEDAMRYATQLNCSTGQLATELFIEQAEALMIGSTFRRINVGQIKGFWMPLPLFEEQIAIANYLDQETARIDQMIEKAKAVRPLSASTLVS